MSKPAIHVENLSKQYRLGLVGSGSLRDDLIGMWYRMRGKEAPTLVVGQENTLAEASGEYVWALKDINFEVQQGEVLGIIGKNGAGKSTLLKVLSQITAPTTGSIKMRGRVASLLEVGTGMHPELTGRDNIYLNGAILGMKRHEIKAKLDEIVDFAGIAKYIDTPVKRYSSGMRVRLGFAVAAYLEPEILIVDEVLAVGDAEFQKKAIGKMQEVSKGGGRTVLFVSHNMDSVSTLTQKCIFLREGKVQAHGKTDEVIDNYLGSLKSKRLTYEDSNSNSDTPKITKVSLITSNPNNYQKNGEPFEIRIVINFPIKVKEACLSVQVKDASEKSLIHLWNLNDIPFGYEAGDFELSLKIPNLRLYMGTYYLTFHLSEPPGGQKFQTLNNICPFYVVMHGQPRLFQWQPNTCAYIEDGLWSVSKQ